MLRDVLVPLDGSRWAEHALDLAASLAQQAKARLHLVHVVEPATAFSARPRPVTGFAAEGAGSVAADADYLAGVASALRGRFGTLAEFREMLGLPGPEICEEASRLDCDLIVMATHGRGALQRFWLGSVADFVVRHAGTPVLLVPPDGVLSPRPVPLKLLVALDGSSGAEAILPAAAELARLTHGRMTLVHVEETLAELAGDRGGDPALRAVYRREMEQYLERIARQLRKEGLAVATRVVTGINAAGGLLEAVEALPCDLLAMTTHGAGPLRRLVIGSVANKVIQRLVKPVLILRPARGLPAEPS